MASIHDSSIVYKNKSAVSARLKSCQIDFFEKINKDIIASWYTCHVKSLMEKKRKEVFITHFENSGSKTRNQELTQLDIHTQLALCFHSHVF